MTWLYLLKTKDEVSKVIQDFHKLVKTQFGKEIKTIRSNNGTEYLNQRVQKNFRENDIIHETTCVGTPQQNGIAERKNRHLLEMTRSLLLENKVPPMFWDNALSFAVYLSNSTPTSANDYKTPIQVLSSHVTIPYVLNLPPKIFGCVAYIHIQKPFRTKLEPKAEKCVFLGMGANQKGYKCYNPSTRKFYTTMDVTFLENESFFNKIQDPIQEGSSHDEPDFDLTFLSDPLVADLGPGLAADSGPGPANDSGPVAVDSGIGPAVDSGPAAADSGTNQANNSGPVAVDSGSKNDEGSEQQNSAETGQSGHSPNEIKQWIDLTEAIPREDNNEVCSSETQPRYPARVNRGKPPKRYIPEDGTSKEITYPIANYISTEKLPQPLKNFADQLSSIAIPEKVEDALKSKEWTRAMTIEMEALEKNCT